MHEFRGPIRAATSCKLHTKMQICPILHTNILTLLCCAALRSARANPAIRTGRLSAASPRCRTGRTGSLTRCSSISAISRRFRSGVYRRSSSQIPRTGYCTRRGMPAVMKALGPSRSYSPLPVITSPKSNSPATCQPHRRGSAENSPGCIRRSGSPAARPEQSARPHRASSSSSPSRNFCGNPRRSCRARHPSICPRMKASQPGSICARRPTGRAALRQ